MFSNRHRQQYTVHSFTLIICVLILAYRLVVTDAKSSMEHSSLDIADNFLPNITTTTINNKLWITKTIDTIDKKTQQQQPQQRELNGGRIYGGSIVYDNSIYPFIANFYCCGGTLIRPDMVLTAAHCLKRCIQIGNDVLIGGTTIDNAISYHTVSEIYQHPRWNDDTNEHDIAIIKLNCASTAPRIRMNFNKNLTSIPGTNALITGFGTLEDGSDAYELHDATVQLISDPICLASYTNYRTQYNNKFMICAGTDIGGIDTCQGDSGGPIIIQQPTTSGSTTMIQIGITSWGYGCGLVEYPGVYTRLSAYRRFVYTIIKNHSNSRTSPNYCPV